ncbi:hypothetical protein BRADI_5g03201v3 [Brachypodium distachyon]|uniref:Uncharacterized protein n=1 Tax=Brachypodium distachyon TaxID=15368 RepID=A0A0Q3E6H6_BRADI|nr:hypothetical protein BRADI_5g03201v3 [Brachypodium distachyon]
MMFPRFLLSAVVAAGRWRHKDFRRHPCMRLSYSCFFQQRTSKLAGLGPIVASFPATAVLGIDSMPNALSPSRSSCHCHDPSFSMALSWLGPSLHRCMWLALLNMVVYRYRYMTT